MFFSVTHQAEGAPFPRLRWGQALCGERDFGFALGAKGGFRDGGFFTAAAKMIDARPCQKDCNVFTMLVIGASFHAVAIHTI